MKFQKIRPFRIFLDFLNFKSDYPILSRSFKFEKFLHKNQNLQK